MIRFAAHPHQEEFILHNQHPAIFTTLVGGLFRAMIALLIGDLHISKDGIRKP